MTVSRAHYVYAHRRQTDGALFYVGKGKNRRAWSSSGRNRHWQHVAAKHGYEVQVIRANLPEPCALALERIIIAANKAGGLVNLVDGGGGTSGWRHSDETRRRIGAASKARPMTDRQREALDAYRPRDFSEEHRARISAAKKGKTRKPHSAETRAKIAAAHVGMRPSEGAIQKMRLAKIGKGVGRESPTYDHTERRWQHDDGRVFVGTRGDLIQQFGLGAPCVSAVINGRQRSVKGWRLAQ